MKEAILVRDNVSYLVRAFANALPIHEPIYEIGSYQVQGQEGFADMRPYFPGKEYVGCDVRSGPGVDRVENVHKLSMPDESVGTILMLETLEHVANPFIALKEIHRVLKPDGLLLMTSHTTFPIHAFPADYWRFTPQGFDLLMERFSFRLVGFQGDPSGPHTVIGIASRSRVVPDQVAMFKKLTPETHYTS